MFDPRVFDLTHTNNFAPKYRTDRNIAPTGSGKKAHNISRADLAAFIIAQHSSVGYLHQAVTIANS